jgi:vacuolar protein sorting-associated protein 26
VRDLAPPGELSSAHSLPFEFREVEMQYESYRGMQVRPRAAPATPRSAIDAAKTVRSPCVRVKKLLTPCPPPPLAQVRLRYALRVTVARGLGQSLVKDFPFWVRNEEAAPPPPGEPIKVRTLKPSNLASPFFLPTADTAVQRRQILLPCRPSQ